VSDRQEILEQIKTDIETKINPSNGYNTQPAQVIHGIVNFDDILMKPVIAFFAASDEVQDEELGTSERLRILNIIVYGYADVGLGNYSNLFDLLEDLEKFLDSSDFTYYNNSLFGTAEFTFSPDNLKSMFVFNLRVFYHQNI
jgi:hypothetical protein